MRRGADGPLGFFRQGALCSRRPPPGTALLLLSGSILSGRSFLLIPLAARIQEDHKNRDQPGRNTAQNATQ